MPTAELEVPRGQRPVELLPLPKRAEARLIAPDIVLFRNVILWGARLIDYAETEHSWFKSTQTTAKGKRGVVNNHRSSDSMAISVGEDLGWELYERGLVCAFHSCVAFYRGYNPHLSVVCDTGFGLLRYRVGGEYKAHVDNVAGTSLVEGSRQLSAIAYLNDDYLGGELAFPRQSLRFKPTAGDILMFPANFCYPHASLPITQGTKYAVATWFVSKPGSK